MTRMFERSGSNDDCRWAEPLLSCSRDGAITEEEEAKLARHLSRCGACAAFLAELYEVEGCVHEAFRCDPEPRGWQKIAAFIDAGEAVASGSGSGRLAPLRPSARLGNPLGHPIARVAAAVLVLAGAFVAVRGFYPQIFRDTPARVEADQPVPPVAGLRVVAPETAAATTPAATKPQGDADTPAAASEEDAARENDAARQLREKRERAAKSGR